MDFTNAKQAPVVFPENAIETAYGRMEPIVGPNELRNRYLFGIPLVSQLKDPTTGKNQVITDDILKDIIDSALQTVELECNIDIFPVIRKEKQAYDRNTYESFGYMMLEKRPVNSLISIGITPANGVDVYTIPLEWVETALAVRGQINVIPMTASFIQGGYVPAGQSGASYFLAVIGNRSWVPAYWQVTYSSGFPDGLVPRPINDLIGTIAAMDVLSMLAVTYARTNSHSLGIDSLSQSISTPGPQLFKVRLEELTAKRTLLTNKVKALMGRKFVSSNV
jgi:hypothetical protein